MKMEDVFKEIREGTGLEVELEVPDAEAMEWPYTIEDSLRMNSISYGRIRGPQMVFMSRNSSP